MRLNTEEKIIIRDDKNQKNILVQVNIKKGKTAVVSNFSAWENLAYILEGLGATAQECVREGKSKKEVIKAINDYLDKVIESYIMHLRY